MHRCRNVRMQHAGQDTFECEPQSLMQRHRAAAETYEQHLRRTYFELQQL